MKTQTTFNEKRHFLIFSTIFSSQTAYYAYETNKKRNKSIRFTHTFEENDFQSSTDFLRSIFLIFRLGILTKATGRLLNQPSPPRSLTCQATVGFSSNSLLCLTLRLSDRNSIDARLVRLKHVLGRVKKSPHQRYTRVPALLFKE